MVDGRVIDTLSTHRQLTTHIGNQNTDNSIDPQTINGQIPLRKLVRDLVCDLLASC